MTADGYLSPLLTYFHYYPNSYRAFLLNMTWFTSRDERQRVGNEADSGDRLEAAPE